MYYKQETGKFGEDKATQYLIKKGYKILGKNFRCYFGEIDIIAKDVATNEIVFVEVKTRCNNKYGTPAEAVDKNKRKHIFKTAKYFLYIHKLEDVFVRIDVIEVYQNKINHIKQVI